MSFRNYRLGLILPLTLIAGLSACKDKEAEKQPEFEEENIIEPVAPEVAEPEPAPVENVQEAPKPAPAPVVPDEQQILDDAAAVGMTARINRNASASAEEPNKADESGEAADDLDGIY